MTRNIIHLKLIIHPHTRIRLLISQCEMVVVVNVWNNFPNKWDLPFISFLVSVSVYSIFVTSMLPYFSLTNYLQPYWWERYFATWMYILFVTFFFCVPCPLIFFVIIQTDNQFMVIIHDTKYFPFIISHSLTLIRLLSPIVANDVNYCPENIGSAFWDLYICCFHVSLFFLKNNPTPYWWKRCFERCM